MNIFVGTAGAVTCARNGVCTCQENVEGDKCDTCSDGYYDFPTCTGTQVSQIQMQSSKLTALFLACACNTQGTVGNNNTCDNNGVCPCQENVQGHKCDKCSYGYSNFPTCTGTFVTQI